MFETICWLVLTHFIADACFQSREMGQKKSKELYWWQLHVLIIFGAFLWYDLWFAATNAVIHGVIDLVIWNVYPLFVISRKGGIKNYFSYSKVTRNSLKDRLEDTWKYWEDPVFYAFIIFDCILHVMTIIGLYMFGNGMI